ncbi:MAG: ComF family protein [Flavobacteriaceae bacterium]|nr:ComF family protein [Flavobacteriaceae bacterium]
MPFANHTNVKENAVALSFYGRVPIQSAAALLLFYKKGKVQQIIHQLKYKGNQEIGSYFGHWLGCDLAASKHFNSVEMIVPVPLHPKKLKLRGYNQVANFGMAIAKILNARYVDDKLIKVSSTESQTKKHRTERVKNVNEIFTLNDVLFFEGKHILLVDDVITTGATLEVCCKELLKTKSIKISIASLAFTV